MGAFWVETMKLWIVGLFSMSKSLRDTTTYTSKWYLLSLRVAQTSGAKTLDIIRRLWPDLVRFRVRLDHLLCVGLFVALGEAYTGNLFGIFPPNVWMSRSSRVNLSRPSYFVLQGFVTFWLVWNVIFRKGPFPLEHDRGRRFFSSFRSFWVIPVPNNLRLGYIMPK